MGFAIFVEFTADGIVFYSKLTRLRDRGCRDIKGRGKVGESIDTTVDDVKDEVEEGIVDVGNPTVRVGEEDVFGVETEGVVALFGHF